MKHSLVLMIFAMTIVVESAGQAKTRKLSSSINHPSLNLYAPYMSADANAMVFVSDNAEDQILTPFYTVREATDWREPQMLPKNVHTKLNFLFGYALSADGKMLYTSTIKSPGVGGYDIVVSDIKGTSFADPVNPGLPINTKAHEASPSVTPDGSTIYFMRCEKMNPDKAEGCKIFRATKKVNGLWDEPVALPANINTGNSQAPRIMADNETLIFSSDKISPSKGGMDLYLSRFTDGSWSDPIAMDFVNTDKNDQYVSVTALGRYLLRDTPGSKKNELVEYLIPENLRPKGMMKVEGKVSDDKGDIPSVYLSAIDIASQKRFYTGRPSSDGSFFLYLKEGSQYDFGIDPEKDNFTYYSKNFDLTSERIPQVEKISTVIKPLVSGDEWSPDVIKFKAYSSELDERASSAEFKRLFRLMNANPVLKFEVNVQMEGYKEDSLKSDPDLTETMIDSVIYQYNGVDSLGQPYTEDSLAIKTLYHNNRSTAQAKAIVKKMTALGISADRLTYEGSAIPATMPGRRNLKIKIISR
jgi:hypothetical protein